MHHPLRENLEVFTDDSGTWVRCTRCLHVFCALAKDWRSACKVNHSEPTKAGPLMSVLLGQYLIQQHYCPSCYALIDTDLVEKLEGNRNNK